MVIGNCQASPLANALSTRSRDTTFEAFSVHIIPEELRESAVLDFISEAKGSSDLIISIPLSDEWGPLSVARIRQTFEPIPVVLVSNVYYDGLHPDLTYIGGLAHRLEGPLDDYHSRICLASYLRGYPPEVTRNLFCWASYERLGYFAQHDKSIKELRFRDRQVDVSVLDVLVEAVTQELSFLSVNHPTAALFAPFAGAVLKFLAAHNLALVAPGRINPYLLENSLVAAPVFPIYPEIAHHHGVGHLGSYWFKRSGWRANVLDLREFIAAEFAAFQAVDQAALRALPIAAAVVESATALPSPSETRSASPVR